MPRRRVVAQPMEWLRILALVVFALATLGGLYQWTVIQVAFGMMSGRLSVDSFPIPPFWLVQFLGYSLLFGTPLAILLLTIVGRRISLPLWIVIAPLLVFDIWMSLSPITSFLVAH